MFVGVVLTFYSIYNHTCQLTSHKLITLKPISQRLCRTSIFIWFSTQTPQRKCNKSVERDWFLCSQIRWFVTKRGNWKGLHDKCNNISLLNTTTRDSMEEGVKGRLQAPCTWLTSPKQTKEYIFVSPTILFWT